MRVLGIEGTAWAASAALFEADENGMPVRSDATAGVGASENGAAAERDDVDPHLDDVDPFLIETDAYVPEQGGIDPRKSSDHMAEAIPRVVESVLDVARERAARERDLDPDHDLARAADDPPIDAVAFSRGPGLGPCLRIAGTAARALADSYDVPLVGVNHMVAHLEIGRTRSGFSAPVCLNASGANAHLLGYHSGRYRVLGETMDTGVGNALDKVARHAGLSHPGGPKLEEAAADGELLDLPYVVKGMDFSFAGIVTAAQDALDDGESLSDVAFSLQETIFAILTEVAERALALTGSDELVLGGGVGQNARLREMLETMCEDRGAAFYAPEPRFLRDNAGMIALTGARQLAAGDTLAIEDSHVLSDYRPDQVEVAWREEPSVSVVPVEERVRRGAEAVVEVDDDRVRKRRVAKRYRHPELDDRLRRERVRSEARLTARARAAGVPTPVVLDVDPAEATVEFSVVGDRDLQAALSPEHLGTVGRHLARLHREGIVHGDPTTRNVRVDVGNGDRGRTGGDGAGESTDDGRVYLIDFGLGFVSGHVEDQAMDLHVLEGSLAGTADDPAPLRDALEAGYREHGDEAVLDRLREIEGRGRYQ